VLTGLAQDERPMEQARVKSWASGVQTSRASIRTSRPSFCLPASYGHSVGHLNRRIPLSTAHDEYIVAKPSPDARGLPAP
jgi:hypothetical protein